MQAGDAPQRGRRRFFASARARILASYLILLLFSTVVATIALREVLLARAGERVDDALVQETEEFGRLARIGRDPRTSRPFGNDVRAIFEVFLSRNVPAEREAFFTYAGGVLRDQRRAEVAGRADPRDRRRGDDLRQRARRGRAGGRHAPAVRRRAGRDGRAQGRCLRRGDRPDGRAGRGQ
jgi:hypothetical protein